MSITLYAYDVAGGRLPGSFTADGNTVAPGSAGPIARRVAAMVARGGVAEVVARSLDGYSNGRVIYSSSPEPPDAPGWLREPQPVQRFDPREPRDPHSGEWIHGPGGVVHGPGGKIKALDPFYNEIPETKGQVRVHAPVPSSGRGRADDAAIAAWRKQHPVAPPITKAEARDEARPVSAEEFQALAREGLNKLGVMNASHQPAAGLDRHWDKIKTDTYAKVLQSWGGATIDPRTGTALPDGADAYALTVKSHSMAKVSIPEGASAEKFDAAMDEARARFATELEKGSHYLGVFHDDDLHRIDIDPVVVVTSEHDVETIGAYTHAIGGAYHFKTGNGFWPPYVDPELGGAMAA